MDTALDAAAEEYAADPASGEEVREVETSEGGGKDALDICASDMRSSGAGTAAGYLVGLGSLAIGRMVVVLPGGNGKGNGSSSVGEDPVSALRNVLRHLLFLTAAPPWPPNAYPAAYPAQHNGADNKARRRGINAFPGHRSVLTNRCCHFAPEMQVNQGSKPVSEALRRTIVELAYQYVLMMDFSWMDVRLRGRPGV